MKILVTGAAGFIGFNLSRFLLEKKFKVVGIDNINDYYSTKLKKDRINQLKKFKNTLLDLIKRLKVKDSGFELLNK